MKWKIVCLMACTLVMVGCCQNVLAENPLINENVNLNDGTNGFDININDVYGKTISSDKLEPISKNTNSNNQVKIGEATIVGGILQPGELIPVVVPDPPEEPVLPRLPGLGDVVRPEPIDPRDLGGLEQNQPPESLEQSQPPKGFDFPLAFIAVIGLILAGLVASVYLIRRKKKSC